MKVKNIQTGTKLYSLVVYIILSLKDVGSYKYLHDNLNQ